MGKVASIILAGGQGTRLFPLTQMRCKPSVCFGGRYRLIDIPISNSLNAKIPQIFIISQYLASSLQQHILETYHLGQFQTCKIQLLCPEETPSRKAWFKGTADAVRQNLEYFAATSADYFLILSGDQLYNIDFVEMLNFAIKQDADLVIASLPVEEKEAKRMGLLKTNASNEVLDFFEKPTDPKILKQFALSPAFLQGHHIAHPKETHYLGSMGIYIFKRKALFELLKEEGDDFGKDLIPKQMKMGKTAAYVYKGYWEDIGTISSYFQANIALTFQRNCLNTYDKNNPIFTHPQHLPSPLIKGTQLTQAIISQGAVIEAKEISNSILGIQVVVKKGTIIRNSIVLGNLFYSSVPGDDQAQTNEYTIGEDCLIENAIIDEHSIIGDRVQLTNVKKLQHYDGNGIYIRDGIIIVTSGTKVPDGYIL